MKTNITEFSSAISSGFLSLGLLSAAFLLTSDRTVLPALATAASTSLVVQSLNSESSYVKFKVTGALIQTAGAFRQPTGLLKLDSKSLEPRAVQLQLNTSNISFDQSSSGSALSGDALASTFSKNELLFVSTSITALANSEYRVKGQVRWGDQRGILELRAKKQLVSERLSRFSLTVSGPIDLPLPELPFSLGGAAAPKIASRGSLIARLEFSKLKN